MAVNNLIKLRRGSDWSSNPTLAEGEPGFDTSTNTLKIGDGSTAWNLLQPVNSGLVHPIIAAASSSDNSSNTFIQDLLLDDNGHVTGIAVGTASEGGGGGGISNVVEDTTPQLGGNLDLNSKNLTGTGHIDIAGSGHFSSNITANSFIKDGGTSSQFLKADGSVDTSTYSTTDTQLTEEQVEDFVGGMLTGNTETGIAVTYQDDDGTIDFVVASQTDENFTTADHSKLDGIEASADVTDTANVTSAGALMDSELTDLAGVKGVTISTLQVKPSEGAFSDGDKTKLDAIEASADVTDTANVTSAGALMDSEVTNLSQVKAFDSSDYATAAQGTKADSAQQPPSEGAFANGDKTKLDGIEASADVTDTANVTSAGALMDSELTDLAGVKGVTISTLQVKPSEGAFADGDKTKLDAIEASADVTDTANVTSAGALMDSELASITDVKALDQSVIAGASPNLVTTNMTDASNKRFMTDAQETKLDSVESSADVTDTANVTSAGALMDSELTDLAGVKGVTISTLQVKPSEGAFANGDKTKLDAIEASADVTDATNVNAAGAVMNSDSTTAGMSFVVDEDNMSSDSDTKVPTQQSVKAYVDATIVPALTTEQVQDIVGGMVDDTETGISVTYDDTNGNLEFVVDHDAANNFVANEHIDHTSVTLTAGDGLTGGGDISANRTFAVSVDDSTIEINSDALRIKDAAITPAKIGVGTFVFNEAGANYDFRVEGDTDANLLFLDASKDSILIGATTDGGVNSKLHVYEVANTNTTYSRTINVLGRGYSSTDGTYYHVGTEIRAEKYLSASTTDGGYAIGVNAAPVIYSPDGTNVLAEVTAFRCNPSINSAASNVTVTNAYDIKTVPHFAGTNNTVTNHYGLYLGDAGAGGTTPTNEYGVYQVNTAATNYFGGTLDVRGAAVFNEGGAAVDFRVEGDTDIDLLFVDGSEDTVQIGKLNINGAFTFPTADGSANQILKTDGNGAVSWAADGGGGGGGSMTTVKANGSQVGGADIVTLDFATDFTIGETPDTEINISIADGAITSAKMTTSTLVLNEAGAAVDFRVEGDTDTHLLFVDGSADKVGIGTDSPSYTLHVDGNIGLTNEGFYAASTGVILGVDGWIYNDGGISMSHGRFAADGDAQNTTYILRGATTNASFTTIQNNGANVVLASNRTMMFTANIVGRRTDQVNASNSDNAAYVLKGCLHNDGYGAALVGSVSKTVIAETDSSWDVQATVTGAGAGGADQINIQCKGANSKNVNWVAKLELLEVGGSVPNYTESNILNTFQNEIIP